jgi:hypothetical protein
MPTAAELALLAPKFQGSACNRKITNNTTEVGTTAEMKQFCSMLLVQAAHSTQRMP